MNSRCCTQPTFTICCLHIAHYRLTESVFEHLKDPLKLLWFHSQWHILRRGNESVPRLKLNCFQLSSAEEQRGKSLVLHVCGLQSALLTSPPLLSLCIGKPWISFLMVQLGLRFRCRGTDCLCLFPNASQERRGHGTVWLSVFPPSTSLNLFPSQNVIYAVHSLFVCLIACKSLPL